MDDTLLCLLGKSMHSGPKTSWPCSCISQDQHFSPSHSMPLLSRATARARSRYAALCSGPIEQCYKDSKVMMGSAHKPAQDAMSRAHKSWYGRKTSVNQLQAYAWLTGWYHNATSLARGQPWISHFPI